ncbi:DUF4062 domain-containing protein [Vibrio splendidus]|uniref:DUF4062 domain-containing protein n=1 Tax=Vibrio coralliirubri TaxID=1516159 RepID=UPI00069AF1A4|nr:DUF4062 domain-containing protein [Vibrio coralliirubri]
MDKRYQVFVSSTYADLKEERQQVLQTLMEMDCIPSGMEMFPATDEEQWEFIKKVIDDCDYYLLVIGGRYGSLSDDGISYTEKEYQYAVEKGIKVIAFIHESPEELSVSKTDIDPRLMEKLKAFRQNVSTGRLVKFWKQANELPGLVALSLTKTIKMYPAIGWVRANSQSNTETLNEINELRKENDNLRKRIGSLDTEPNVMFDNLADLSETIDINGTYKTMRGGNTYSWNTQMSWGDLFGKLSPYLLQSPSDNYVKNRILDDVFLRLDLRHDSYYLDDQDFQTIKMQFMALGLVDVQYSKTTQGGMALFWKITESGKRTMFKLRTIQSTLE